MSGRRVGILQAANITGCTLGSLVTGLILFDAVGTSGVFRALAVIGAGVAVFGFKATRAVWFGAVSAVVFFGLLFMDYFLGLYNPVLAHSIRKAGEGISWIFQMGMGYTFYLPFAFYVAGLLCWSYTVIRLVTMGRLAGYCLALMFIAGYALLFSSLTLMARVQSGNVKSQALPPRM